MNTKTIIVIIVVIGLGFLLYTFFGTANTPEPLSEEVGSELNAVDYIGMTEVEAEAYAEANNVDFRVGVRDGEDMPVTHDLRPSRITASVSDGVVTSYTVE